MRFAGVFLALAALPGAAQESASLADLPRATFETELRAALWANADVIAAALREPSPAAEEMQAQIDDDLALLVELAPALLQGHDIALFTEPGCPSCDLAEQELREISGNYGATFIRHDLTTPQAADWAAALLLQSAPFYVLPDMILNGHMPKIVLQKYLMPKVNPEGEDQRITD